ncbi:MAG TPA: hypothetical protein VG964_03135 [Candidatus Saccharimonadales bacterium]|nr:hypothetical protein [Candidatus Saccharimonadales bacterium]
MRARLNPAQQGRLLELFMEIVRLTGKGNRTYDNVREAMQDIRDGRFVSREPKDMFIPPAQQITWMQLMNDRFKWGFTSEQFEQLPAPPAWPQERLQAVVLVPYFNSRKKTFEELRRAIYYHTRFGLHDPYRVYWEEGVDKESDYVRHVTGTSMRFPGMYWRIVDLGINRGNAPWEAAETRQPLAGAEVLAAAALFPKWLKAMDGQDVPFVWVGGYKIMADLSDFPHSDAILDRDPSSYVPLLHFDRLGNCPRIMLNKAGMGDMQVAVPTVID